MWHMHRPLLIALPIAVLSLAGAAHAADTRTTPFEGAELLHHVTASQDVWVLKVDLCASGITVRASAFSERQRTVGSFASLVDADAAVNGDFFSFDDYRTSGVAGHGGDLWGGVDGNGRAPVSFAPHNVDVPHHRFTRGAIDGALEVVSGRPTLLDDGAVVGAPNDALCTQRHPRTALGISEDHRSLFIVVVDGRRETGVGMTCPELANFMHGQGAFDAVNLDGGGSSTMVVNGAVKNHPSDGSQRVVGNALGIRQTGGSDAPYCPEVAPRGVLERATCDAITGWAVDDDQPQHAIKVAVFVGGPSGSGAPRFDIAADLPRDDLAGELGDGVDVGVDVGVNHGFSFRVPNALRDGSAKDIYVSALDVGDVSDDGMRPNRRLEAVPMSVTCAPPALPFVDGRKRHVINPDALAAWQFATTEIAGLDAAVVDAVVEGDALPAAPRVVRADGDDAVYVVDGALKRHVQNPASLAAWRFAVEVVDVAVVDALEEGAPWPLAPFTFRAAGDASVYVLDEAPLPPPVVAGEGEGEEGGAGEGGVVDEGEGESVVVGTRDIYVGKKAGCAQTPLELTMTSALGLLVLLRRRRR